MKEHYSIYKNIDGNWCIGARSKGKVLAQFKTQKEALIAARKFASEGYTIIVHSESGEVRKVLGLNNKPSIRSVKTKSKLKAKDINKAVAIAMESYSPKG